MLVIVRVNCDEQSCNDIHLGIEMVNGVFICREVIKRMVIDPENNFKVRELLD